MPAQVFLRTIVTAFGIYSPLRGLSSGPSPLGSTIYSLDTEIPGLPTTGREGAKGGKFIGGASVVGSSPMKNTITISLF